MGKIILKALIGDKELRVELTQPMGAAGGYHIMIDNVYYGTIHKAFVDGEYRWIVSLQNEKTAWLSPEDKEVMLEAVRENEQKNQK